MKFLYVHVLHATLELPGILEKMGHTCSCLFNYTFNPNDFEVDEPLSVLREALRAAAYDAVISHFYVPVVSMLCEELGVLYISWVRDSPQLAVYHSSASNSCNRIFLFDKAECERLRELGISNAHYMPLGADIDRGNTFELSDEDEKKFSCDISFVGSLYEDNWYNAVGARLPIDIKEKIDRYVDQNVFTWNSPRPWPILETADARRITPLISAEDLGHFEMPPEYYYAQRLASDRLAELERCLCLTQLAEQFPVELYTRHDDITLGQVRVHPKADYYTDLGKVYYFSKINLGFTLPTIMTGIPLRVYDIMSFGGFVLTNWQEEIGELFEIGKEIAVYHSLDELIELSDHYLANEKERLTIAVNGYRSVQERHSTESRLRNILKIAFK